MLILCKVLLFLMLDLINKRVQLNISNDFGCIKNSLF
jgi:hypothetical protein